MAFQTIKKEDCPHIKELKIEQSEKTECEVCGEKNHLRLCMSCGGVFCCESSRAHNKEHYEATDHPIIKSFGSLPYSWTWCWKCNAYIS